MAKSASPAPDKPETPSATFIQLNSTSVVPSHFRCLPAFTITRLKSPQGLSDRITKLSPVPALLVSVSLKSLPSSSYQLWTADKLNSTPDVHPFHSNVLDFDQQPRCWAGRAFDFVHFTIPRSGLDDIAEDVGFGHVRDYRPTLLADDLVVAQITRSVLPFLGRNDTLSALALDQFGLILGAHLLQNYGVVQKKGSSAKGGLAAWQLKRATELLHENLDGHIQLSQLARECGLSTSYFARSFKAAFGVSPHQWLTQHRIEHAKELMNQKLPLRDVALQSGFCDQPAFTRAFQRLVGVSPARWRRHSVSAKIPQ